MTTPAPELPFRRILVPVDGSDHGFHAARTAAGLARSLGSSLTILTVYDAPSASLGEPNYSRALTEALDHARAVVEQACRAVRDAGGPEPEVEWLAGSPAERIISVAQDGNYDLVVMGTHGRGRLTAALLGSVSNAVA